MGTTMGLKSWTPCLLGWRKSHSPPAPAKLAKMKKEMYSHRHAYRNTMAITGLISHFTENPAHPVLTLPLFPSNTG